MDACQIVASCCQRWKRNDFEYDSTTSGKMDFSERCCFLSKFWSNAFLVEKCQNEARKQSIESTSVSVSASAFLFSPLFTCLAGRDDKNKGRVN